jgi:hypothetical protein
MVPHNTNMALVKTTQTGIVYSAIPLGKNTLTVAELAKLNEVARCRGMFVSVVPLGDCPSHPDDLEGEITHSRLSMPQRNY